MSEERAAPPQPGDEVRLLDILAVVVRRWRLVAGMVVAAMLLGGALTLMQPQSYTARTLLVLLQGGRRTGLGAALPAQLQIPTLSLFGSDPNQKLIDVILGSVALQDSMVNVVKRARPRQEGIETTVREILADRTDTRSNSDGSIQIIVSDRDPQLARLMADTFPALINALAASVSAEAARNRRDFAESQLAGARANLEAAEQALASYQRQGRAPEVAEQARQTLEVAAGVQQRIMEQEVKVAELRRTRTEDHPELRSAVAQLEGLRRQLRSLESGAGGFFPSLRESPDLMVNSARLLREYKKAEQVYVSLTAALAEAQIQANENLAAVGVLDRARPSSNPRWVLILRNLIISAVLGGILGLALAFVADYVARARLDPGNARFFAAWEAMKDDVVPGRRRRRVSGAGA